MKKFLQYLKNNSELIITVLFLLILPFIPFIYSGKALDLGLFPPHMPLSIWLTIIFIWFAAKLLKNKNSISLTQHEILLGIPALVFILIAGTSAFLALNTKESLYWFIKELSFWLSLMIFYTILRSNTNAKQILIKTFLVFTLVYISVGLFQFSQGDFAQFKAATKNKAYYFSVVMNKVISTLQNKNLFSSYLFLSLPISLFASFFMKKLWRLLGIISTILTIVFIVALVAKTIYGALGFFGLIIGILLYLYLFSIYPKKSNFTLKSWHQLVGIILPFALVISMVLLMKFTNISVLTVVKEKVEQVINPEKNKLAMYNKDNPTSAETRMLSWGKTYQMAKDHPWIGVGPGNWRIYLPSYGLDEFEDSIRQGNKSFQRPHSDILWILSEQGFLGFAAWAIFYLLIIILAFRNFLNSSDNSNRWLNGFIGALMISYLAVLFTDFSRERISHVIPFMLLTSLVIFSTKSKNIGFKIKFTYALPILAVIIFVSSYSVYMVYNKFEGEKSAAYFWINFPKKAWAGTNRMYDRIAGSIYCLDNFSTPVEYYKASALANLDRKQEALKYFDLAYKYHPYHVNNLNNYGATLEQLGKRDEAKIYFEKILEISPRNLQALVNLSIIYHNQQQSEKALEYILRAPVKKDISTKQKEVIINVCRVWTKLHYKEFPKDKLIEWIQDENKIMASFVNCQKERLPLNVILLNEFSSSN